MPDQDRLLHLADQVMTLSRNAIVMQLRYMDMAVFRLRPEPAETTYATDGRYLFYGPRHVLRRYRTDESLPARDYLHALLHCVFRHPFIDTLVDRRLWDLAADIAVEAMIGELKLRRFEAGRELSQRPIIDALTDRLGTLTAEKLYHFFREQPPPDLWEDLFRSDDHALWHRPRRRSGEAGEGEESGEEGESGEMSSMQTAQEEGEKQPPLPGQSGDQGEEGDPETVERATEEAAPALPDQLMSAPAGESAADPGDEPESLTMESEAGGTSGESLYRKEEGAKSQNQNIGRGMDTEGGDSATPAGSQSRNAQTRNGVDSPSANGTSGDSGDAASQGDSPSGGSGSGRADAKLLSPSEGRGDRLAQEEDAQSRDQLREAWEEVSRRIQMELESQSHQRGDRAGDLQRQLEIQNRQRYDYTAFLKKFAVLGEHMQINDDEFDPISYTYGLKLYGNLPLIDPLETKEVKRIREFVIAIDTSASTSGALVERFLRRTWEVLSSEQSFFKRIHLMILQCDAEIQACTRITSTDDFEQYIRDFSVKGLGGTDFRPVFRYVDELCRQGEFTHLRGLIYFTDGEGVYPMKKPDYETAFVFVQAPDADAPQVPAWAIKLILEEGEV